MQHSFNYIEHRLSGRQWEPTSFIFLSPDLSEKLGLLFPPFEPPLVTSTHSPFWGFLLLCFCLMKPSYISGDQCYLPLSLFQTVVTHTENQAKAKAHLLHLHLTYRMRDLWLKPVRLSQLSILIEVPKLHLILSVLSPPAEQPPPLLCSYK